MTSLDPERWRRLSPLLERALDLSGDEREAWLAGVDRRDPALADELRALLAEHRALDAEGFLDREPLAAESAPSLAGSTMGVYRLISPLGRGGMGTVWLAERSDGRFEGRAAVKLLNLALAGSGEERFRREGNLLARLTHPHIARLLDAGVSASGQPFLVLEHVSGEAIDAYCDRARLGVEARLRLFLDVLAAVTHAHANLIVHRDIKPANVLVTGDGNVKLLDFGVAKLLADDAGAPTALTREAGVALTPEYAAPEQITGEPVSTATDVYALGVLLYVLLTGRHPAGKALRTPADLVRATLDTQPPRPSDRVSATREESDTEAAAANRGTSPERLRRRLRGDLDTIVGKALKKRPEERYTAVADLADDVRRHLAHAPIGARPDTLAYRSSRFVRRNRLAVGLALAALAAALAGVVGTALQARTARAQRDFALRQLARAEAINDLDSFLLSDAAPSGKPFTVSDLLARAERIVARQQNRVDPRRVDLLIAIGRQYQGLDEIASAKRVLGEAYELSRSLSDPSLRARAACALGSAAGRSGDLAGGEQLVQEGLAELGNEPQLALDRVFCLRRGAEVARPAGQAQLSIDRIRQAQALLRELPVPFELLELRLQIDLAESYRAAGRHAEAAAAAEQAALRLTALGRDDTETAGTLFNNWALALSQLGRPLEAEVQFRRAIDISRADAGEGAVSPMLLINYARVLRELARLDEAADYAERGDARARDTEGLMVVEQALLLRAWIYLDRGEPSRADAVLSEAEPLVAETFPPGHLAFAAIASYRSRLAVQLGERDRALELANEALSICESWVASRDQGADFVPTLLVRRSDVERESGRFEEAAADARRAVSLLGAAAPPGERLSTLGRAYLALGRALDGAGRGAEAREALREAADHLRGSLGADHPDTLAAASSAS